MTTGLFDLDRLVALLGSAPVRVGTFGDESMGDRTVLLRHDVDLSLDAAVDLARALARARLRGTFFFRLRARGYNLASATGMDALREVQAAGHRIGLHWEAMVAAELPPHEVRARAMADHSLLRSLIDPEMSVADVVSVHRPPKNIIGLRLDPPLMNAYAAPYLAPPGALYRSDSNARFDWSALESELHDPVWHTYQLLIHPVWWTIPARDAVGVYRALTSSAEAWYGEWLRGEIEAFARIA